MVSMNSYDILSLPIHDVPVEPLSHQPSDFVYIHDMAIPVMTGDFSSVASSESENAREELYQKIKLATEENEELKEKLSRNNQTMHEQLKIISALHDKIAENSSRHRTILENTVQQNVELEKEKAELAEKVKQLEKVLKMKETCKTDAACGDGDAFSEVDDDFSIIAPYHNGASEADTQDTLIEKGLSLSEIEKLSIEVEEERFMVENVMKLLAEKEEELDKLRENNIMHLADTVVDTVSLKEKLINTEQQLQENQISNQKLLESIESLQKENMELKVAISESQNGEKAMLQKLDDMEKASQFMKDEVANAHQSSLKVLEEKQEMEKSITLLKEQQKKKDDEMLSSAATAAQQQTFHTDTLMAKLINAEQELGAEKMKVENLNRQLSSQGNQPEMVLLLQAQLDSYKADFTAEKLARQFAESELESYAKKTGRKISLSGHRRHGNSFDPSSSESDVPSKINCPVCYFAFDSVQVLENHLERCIANSSN